jgi:apolipoprotein N-acyltransferase
MPKSLRYYLLPILSGIFIGTSYIPFPPWAMFFCLVPLWLFWRKERSYKKIFFAGWITQFVLNLIGFHWIAYTVTEFGQLPWSIGFAVLFLFCTLAHLYYPIAGVLWKWLCQKFQLNDFYSIVLLPPLFIFCERLYPFLFYWHFGYPWLWARLPGYHMAEWIGFFGLNFITLIINALLVFFWLERKPKQWLQRYSLTALGLLVLVNGLGFYISTNLQPTDESMKVLVVQGNIGNLDKIQASNGVGSIDHIVDLYLNLTRQGLEETPGVDLVVWPETAFPVTLNKGYMGRHRRQLARLSTEYNVQILTGSYLRKPFNKQVYNSLVLMDGSEDLHSYEKTVLLAFGEYLPFAQYFPQLKKMLPMVSDFGRGGGPKVFPSRRAQIGAQICYEGLFDEFSTSLQEKGAQIIVNVTNDSWFGYPFEPFQHMYMTLARAVENRIPLVRVTNTGISTVIEQNGQVHEFSPRDEEWYRVYEVPFHSTPPGTFYAKLSNKWPSILFVLMALIIARGRIARTGKH